MFNVVFFATRSGNEPVLEWLKGLDKDEKLTIGADLRTVQLGFPLGMPLCRPLGDGLYEVRSSLPTRKEARLLFFQGKGSLVVVGGFIKETQKTPADEISKARSRMRDYRTKQD